eukprot:6375520-Pyramimonas_sp.AAC.1
MAEALGRLSGAPRWVAHEGAAFWLLSVAIVYAGHKLESVLALFFFKGQNGRVAISVHAGNEESLIDGASCVEPGYERSAW